jgi:hypothetical protein
MHRRDQCGERPLGINADTGHRGSPVTAATRRVMTQRTGHSPTIDPTPPQVDGHTTNTGSDQVIRMER